MLPLLRRLSRHHLDVTTPVELSCLPGRLMTIGRLLSLPAMVLIRRVIKTEFDREGKGQAYTQIGSTYDQVLARLADAGISPIFPIRDEWLPQDGCAWLIIDGDRARDNRRDRYPNQPFMYVRQLDAQGPDVLEVGVV